MFSDNDNLKKSVNAFNKTDDIPIGIKKMIANSFYGCYIPKNNDLLYSYENMKYIVKSSKLLI